MQESESEKKGRGKLIIIVILLVLLLGGGGAGFYFLRPYLPAAAPEKTSAKSDSKRGPDEEPEEAEEKSNSDRKSLKSASASSLEDALADDDDVKQIVELPPFIVNLADENQARYLRMTVSLGISDMEKPSPIFITRVRNAMLAVLSVKASEEVLSIKGKAKLRRELLRAAQAASSNPEVHAIYITDFIVQL